MLIGQKTSNELLGHVFELHLLRVYFFDVFAVLQKMKILKLLFDFEIDDVSIQKPVSKIVVKIVKDELLLGLKIS